MVKKKKVRKKREEKKKKAQRTLINETINKFPLYSIRTRGRKSFFAKFTKIPIKIK